ncbi:MAG: ROK family protein [Metamycoplasmataceae bacterium]
MEIKKITYDYAAIDIGGTNARFAIIENGEIIVKESFLTFPDNPKKTLNMLNELLTNYGIKKLGICIPGQANFETGIIALAINIPGWVNFDLRKYIQENTNVEKIIFQNDANAMAFACHKYYQKNSKDITQFFTVSTGLGAGLIVNDEIFNGYNNKAQEIAYIPTSFNKKEENHLSMGSAEYFASGSGIAKRAQKLTGDFSLTTKEIFDKFKKNGAFSEIINEGIEALGNTIAASIAFLNPNSVAFGGSVAEYNPWYIKAAIMHAKNVTYPAQFEEVTFLDNPFGDDLALFGIYWYAQKKLGS